MLAGADCTLVEADVCHLGNGLDTMKQIDSLTFNSMGLGTMSISNTQVAIFGLKKLLFFFYLICHQPLQANQNVHSFHSCGFCSYLYEKSLSQLQSK
jgi:hypothetical protein